MVPGGKTMMMWPNPMAETHEMARQRRREMEELNLAEEARDRWLEQVRGTWMEPRVPLSKVRDLLEAQFNLGWGFFTLFLAAFAFALSSMR